jgi:hypothetical protein
MFGRSEKIPKAKQVKSSEARLQEYLANGWTVKGFSSCMLAAGAMTHTVLLEFDGHLVTHTTVVLNGTAEGSNEVCLTSTESIE